MIVGASISLQSPALPPPVALLTPVPALSSWDLFAGFGRTRPPVAPYRGRKGINQDKGSAAVMRAPVSSGFDKGDKYDVLCNDVRVRGPGLMWQLRGVGAQAPSALSAIPGGCPVCSAVTRHCVRVPARKAVEGTPANHSHAVLSSCWPSKATWPHVLGEGRLAGQMCLLNPGVIIEERES